MKQRLLNFLIALDQLAKKDEQIARLMETVADSTKAVQGAQVLHQLMWARAVSPRPG